MMEMECTCEQKIHRAPIKTILVESGAINKVPEILKEYKNIFMVTEENVYDIAGKKVEEILKASGQLWKSFVLPADSLPTDKNVGRVLIEAAVDRPVFDINQFSNNPDFVLAVGSGSVNDTCRMVSYRLGLEYGVVGTAPSMDGYVSVVAPLIVGNKKIIYNCTTARHIIIDLDVASQAPFNMLLAGVGDMIAKYIAILDWRLSVHQTGEYYCEKIANMVLDATNLCVESAPLLLDRSQEAVKNTVEGLILSGLGIAYSGSSRPASGTEHMVGQTWEVFDVAEGKIPQLHGIEIGYATFMSIIMYRRLYKETKEQWLKDLIEVFLPDFDKVMALQEKIHIPFTVTDRNRFVQGVLEGRTFRVRYTLLQYLYDNGLLEDYANYAYDELMKMR